MAIISELPEGWIEGLSKLPTKVQELIKRFPPNRLYKYKNTFMGIIAGISPEYGFMMIIPEDLNPISQSFKIGDVSPEDLTECELPDGMNIVMEFSATSDTEAKNSTQSLAESITQLAALEKKVH